MTRDEFLCIFPDESIPDSENLLFAQSAVDFLKEKTSLEFSSTDSLPANAKLFIIKYTELMKHDFNVTSESIAGLSQSFRADSLESAVNDLASSLLGGYYSNCSFGQGVRKWRYGC